MPKANVENTNSRKTKHAKAAGAAKPDPIFAAIDAAKQAWKRYEEVCDIDETVAFKLASPAEKRRLRALQSKSEGAELRALRTVCNTPPTSILGVTALIAYLQPDWERSGATYANGETDNLFATLETALKRIAGVPSDHRCARMEG